MTPAPQGIGEASRQDGRACPVARHQTSGDLQAFLADRADVIIPITRPGALSVPEILATRSWFCDRLKYTINGPQT